MNSAVKSSKFPCLILLIIALFLSLINDSETAYAHPMNNGFSELQVGLTRIDFELFLPASGLPSFDTDHNGMLSDAEAAEQRDALVLYVERHLQIRAGQQSLPMTVKGIQPDEKDAFPGITLHLVFASDEVIQGFTIDYNLLFDDADPQHVNFALIEQGADMDQAVLDSAHRTYTYEPLHPAGAESVWWTYFKMGIHHIFTGYDHLLFLLALLIAVSRFSEALRIITAFTVAHSVTLLLSVSGLLHLPSRFIETAIALSIAFVALDNLRRHPLSSKARSWITFAFGLIHGLGFAGVLQEIGLPKGHWAGSLVSFNLGIEAGQAAITALILPFLLRAARKERIKRMLLIGGSSIVLALALYWTVKRLGFIT